MSELHRDVQMWVYCLNARNGCGEIWIVQMRLQLLTDLSSCFLMQHAYFSAIFKSFKRCQWSSDKGVAMIYILVHFVTCR